MYGPVTTSSLVTTDMVAPGMPVLVNAKQIDNATIRLTIAAPTMDATGGTLTGLKTLTVATIGMTGGTSPFASMGMPECLLVPGVRKFDTPLVVADAGQQKIVDVPVMNLGGSQAFAIACSD